MTTSVSVHDGWRPVSFEVTYNNALVNARVLKPSSNELELVQVHLGLKGIKGDKGDPGDAGDLDWSNINNRPPLFFRQEFLNTNVINATHSMQKYPAVRVEDTAGSLWIPKSVTYPSPNNIIVSFDTVFSGILTLS